MYQTVQPARALETQTRGLFLSTAISKTLSKCATAIGLRRLHVDRNHGKVPAGRQPHISCQENSSLGLLSRRERFLRKCSERFFVCSTCTDTGGNPLYNDTDNAEFQVSAPTLRQILLEVDDNPEGKAHIHGCLDAGVLGCETYGPKAFIEVCLAVCPYPQEALSPRAHKEAPQPAELVSSSSELFGGYQRMCVRPAGGNDITEKHLLHKSRREWADPDVVVAVIKKRGWAARDQDELGRHVTSIFDRLHATELEKAQVDISMRPDRQDPFVKAGKLRMKRVYRRRKRKMSEAVARNLSSFIGMMSSHAHHDLLRRQGEGELQQRQEDVKLLRRARGMMRLRSRHYQLAGIRLRLAESEQGRRDLEHHLQCMKAVEAGRVDNIRRSKTPFHLSDFSSSQITPNSQLIAEPRSTRSREERRKLQEAEAQHAQTIRSERLADYKAAHRDSLDDARRQHKRLPYLGGQQSMDGDHLLHMVHGEWEWLQRDFSSDQSDITGCTTEGSRPLRPVELPPAMLAAQRMYSGSRRSSRQVRAHSAPLGSAHSSRSHAAHLHTRSQQAPRGPR